MVNVADINLGFAFAMLQGNIEVSNLQSYINGVSATSALYKAPVATLDQFNLSQGDLSLANQKLGVESIVLSGLKK